MLGIVILPKLTQPLNAELPILVKLLGKVTFVKLVQFSKALESIFVILLGIVICDNWVWLAKAFLFGYSSPISSSRYNEICGKVTPATTPVIVQLLPLTLVVNTPTVTP